jgi:hypothetical protein
VSRYLAILFVAIVSAAGGALLAGQSAPAAAPDAPSLSLERRVYRLEVQYRTGSPAIIRNWCSFLRHFNVGQIEDLSLSGLLRSWKLACH